MNTIKGKVPRATVETVNEMINAIGATKKRSELPPGHNYDRVALLLVNLKDGTQETLSTGEQIFVDNIYQLILPVFNSIAQD